MYNVTLYLKLIIGILIIRVSPAYSQVVTGDEIRGIFSEIDFNAVYYPQKAKVQLDSIRQTFNRTEAITYKGYVEFVQAQLFNNEMEVDSSLYYVEDAISYFTSAEDKMWLSRCQLLLGKIAETTGLYEQAKINYYEAIKLGEGIYDIGVGVAYMGVARCKMALLEEFSEEVENGVRILKGKNRLELGMYADFMEQYFRLGQPDAPEKLNAIADIYLSKGFYDRAVNVYKLIASSYHAQKQYDIAHEYCDRAIDISEANNVGKLILPALYQFKGVLYFKQEQYSVADLYFGKSLDLYAQYNQGNRMLYTYHYLHQIDKAKSNYRKAYANLYKYMDLVDKTTSAEKMRMAKVLEINNKVDVMRSQLAQLKVEKRASEFMLYLVIIVTMFVLAGVGVYIYLYQKSKKAKIEELNKEFHNLLIGIGEKQLLEHRLSVTSKRNKSVHQDIAGVLAGGVDEGGLSDNFDSCYMETIGLLSGAFPQLTRTEVRYAVMICLKLPMEVISKVQNVQPASIRKAKQRIRTKLNVDDNLDGFLQDYLEKELSSLAR